MEDALEQADAVAEGSTPAPEVAPVLVESSAADVQATTPEARTPAEAPPVEVDRDAAAFERLAAGEDPKAIRQNPGPVEPSPAAAPNADAGQSAATPAQQQPPAQAAAAAADQHEGLEANDLETLRRTKLLLPAKRWNELPAESRAALVNNARQIISQRGRISQQIGQAGQQQNNGQAVQAAPLGYEPAPAQQASGATYQTPAGQDPRGVRQGTASLPAGQAAHDGQGGQQADPFFNQLADYLGPELAQGFRQQLQARDQQLSDRDQQLASYQAQLNQQAQVNATVLREFFEPQERQAISEITAQIGRPINPHEQQELLATAQVHYQSARQANESLTWKDAVTRAASGVFQVDHQQQAQRKLAERTQASLRGSPAKPRPAATRAAAVVSQDDKDRLAFESLQAGKSVQQTRAALFAGSMG